MISSCILQTSQLLRENSWQFFFLQRPLLFKNMFLNITLSGGIFKPQKTEQIFGGHLLRAKCFVYIISFCSPTLCQSVYFNTPNSNDEAVATWHTNGGAGSQIIYKRQYPSIVPAPLVLKALLPGPLVSYFLYCDHHNFLLSTQSFQVTTRLESCYLSSFLSYSLSHQKTGWSPRFS